MNFRSPLSGEFETPGQSGSPGWLTPCLLALCAAAALSLDTQVGGWLAGHPLPGSLVKICDWSEAFAHGLGVAIIALAILTLDKAQRWDVPRILTTAYGAGIAANVLKLLVSRTRPRNFDWASTVGESFGPLLAFGAGGSRQQSFPSSHAATAVGLALALAWLYPRGRFWFAALAALACMQRLIVGAHFPSDVLVGAAVGWFVAWQACGNGRLGRCFDCWENHWRGLASAAEPDDPTAEPQAIPFAVRGVYDENDPSAAAG